MKSTGSRISARRVEELVRRHQASLRAYLAYLGCPAPQVDDLVQDTFLAALDRGFEDRGDPATAAWLRTVARHFLTKARARDRRALAFEDLDEADRAWESFEGEDGGTSYVEALRRCLEGVNDRARGVLELRYRANLRRAAIADRLGMSEAGVKSVLVRSKKLLRNCIERRLHA